MLNKTQLDQFEEQGFLVVEDVLDDQVIHNIRHEYDELVDRVTEQRQSACSNWHALTLDEKLTHLIVNDPDAYEFLDISLPLKEGLDESAGVHTGPAVFQLLTNPAILDIAESIVGHEVVSNPVQHTRIKPPENTLSEIGRGNSNMARTGWHQDAAVIVEEAENSPMLTVWVAVSDATPEMGCMQAIAGSHRWDNLGLHCPGRSGVGEIFIPGDFVKEHEHVNLSVKAGGVVLLHRKTWHGAGPNTSDKLRWSFDLRYQPPGFSTGRECFPEFLARSVKHPELVLNNPKRWSEQWDSARTEISTGIRDATFNERWNRYRHDPLCA